MYIFLQKNDFQDTKNIEKNLSLAFLETLKPPYLEQKKIKNLILKQHFKLNEKELLEANKTHRWKSDFFSSSYSWEWLLLGIAQEKIWVDLELIKPRSDILLKKYEKELKSAFWKAERNGFYLLRTAREAILKAANNKNLDLIERTELLSIQKKKEEHWWLPFDWELIFSFQDRKWTVQSCENWTIAYSLCLNNTIRN